MTDNRHTGNESLVPVVLVIGALVAIGIWSSDRDDEDPQPVVPPSLIGGRTYSNRTFYPQVNTRSPTYDLDCVAVGREVWVGTNDPHRLDADNDGWGCED